MAAFGSERTAPAPSGISNGQLRVLGQEQGLTNQHVCSIFEDRRTNLWFGTWGGLFQLKQDRFASVDGPPELGLAVLAIFEDRAGWSLGRHTSRPGLPHAAKTSRPPPACRRCLFRYSVPCGRRRRQSLGRHDWPGFVALAGRPSRALRLRSVVPTPEMPDRSTSIRRACSGSAVMARACSGCREGRFTAYTSADGLPCDSISSIISDDRRQSVDGFGQWHLQLPAGSGSRNTSAATVPPLLVAAAGPGGWLGQPWLLRAAASPSARAPTMAGFGSPTCAAWPFSIRATITR